MSRAPKLSPAEFLSYEKSVALPNGHSYTYYQFLPSGPIKDTIFLIHGFPDHPFTFRYLLPTLQHTFPNLQIIIPSLLGYGSTSSPADPANYTYKSLSNDIVQLVKHLGIEADRSVDGGGIILGGHDWGGALIYRVALHHPSLIRGLFSLSTPFSPPPSSPASKFTHPATVMPNWTYQLQFATQSFEDSVQTAPQIRGFLSAMFGGRTSDGKVVFTADKGINVSLLNDVQKSPLLSNKELDLYVKQFLLGSTDKKSSGGMKGPLNWYRTHQLNFNDEKDDNLFAKFLKEEDGKGKRTFQFPEVPTLFVGGKKDTALPPAMSRGMERWWAEGKLKMKVVDANHWVLWEKPEEVNAIIVEWLSQEFNLTIITNTAGEKSKL